MLLILLLLTGILAVCQINNQQKKQADTIKIGIVASEEEPYLDWMISVVKNMKSTKYTCQFIQISEKQAEQQLRSGELSAVFVIPENYIRSLIYGDESPLIVRFGKGQSTIASFLVKQLGDVASRIMIDTQAGLYALDDYYVEKNLPNRAKDQTTLNIEYLKKVLTREKMFCTEEVAVRYAAIDGSYYFSSVLILFMLFLGLTCPGILRPESNTLHEKLRITGLTIWQNALARYSAFLTVFFLLYSGIALLFTLVLPLTGKNITGAAPSSRTDWLVTFLFLLPILLLICAMIQFVYQIISDELGSILLLFLSILALGYLSGYFYPLSYLPSKIQAAAPFLPTGVLFQYTYRCVTGSWSFLYCLAIMGYSILFFTLPVIIQKLKRRRF